ncbi:MAG: hypothetical protein H6732_16565 [Alphaproteobacteria bacterium]|nr:hypothetical protein [Alphaproteobacteria bacterium]
MRTTLVLLLAACAAGTPSDDLTDTAVAADSGDSGSGGWGDSGDDTDAEPTSCTTVTSWDDDADGTPDRRQSYTSVGHAFVIRRDDDGDGEDELEIAGEFTEDGVQLSRVARSLPDGVVRSRFEVTVDAQGRRLREEGDDDADGTLDRVTTHTYWPDGTPRERRAEVDADDDGTVDRLQTWTFDAQGRTLRYERDDGADEELDAWEVWTYDGVVSELRSYTLADGLQLAERLTHDPTDPERIVKVERDGDRDGTYTSAWDSVETYTFTAAGQPDVDRTDGFGGDGPDGEWDFQTVRTYLRDTLLQQQTRTRRDGTVLDRQTWTWDAADHQTSQEDDLDGDGTITDGWTQTFDADGHDLVYVEIHGGLPTYRSEEVYEGDFVVRRDVDDDADGVLDGRTTWARDAGGRELEVVQDAGADGTPDAITTYTYSCPPPPPE